MTSTGQIQTNLDSNSNYNDNLNLSPFIPSPSHFYSEISNKVEMWTGMNQFTVAGVSLQYSSVRAEKRRETQIVGVPLHPLISMGLHEGKRPSDGRRKD